MQKDSWMQPALLTNEAVLLPALERPAPSAPRFGNRYLTPAASSSVFQPADESWETKPSLALSTYVRPRGSMAGRSVLRAAGVPATPFMQRRRNTNQRAATRCSRRTFR